MAILLTTTFFTFSGDDVATMTGYITDFLGDFTPLLLPIIAVGVGLIILTVIIKALRG